MSKDNLSLGLDSFEGSDIEKGFTDNDLEKGARVPIGTITNGYIKKAEGKWVAVKKDSKSKNQELQVYHNSYSEAITAATDYAESRGYKLDEDDVWNRISMGDKKPGHGKTNRATVGLTKDGKDQKKALHIQVYGMKNKYELNAYIN
jgi:hypothetical protein